MSLQEIPLSKLRPAKQRKPQSLFHFLTWAGGLRPDPDLKSILNGRFGWMVRKSGMSLDTAREACIEEGFLQDSECRDHEPTINDLLELIAAEAAGHKQYRLHEWAAALEHENAREEIGVSSRTCHRTNSIASEGARAKSGNQRKSSMDDERTAAVEMLKSGMATISEIADLAGTSRQLVRYWALAEGIDVAKARRAWLVKEWRRRMKG